MTQHRIRLAEVTEVHEPENAVSMRPLVSRASHGGDLSMTWIRLDGLHRPLRTDSSTRVYYLLEGSASFTVGDERPFEAVAGDTVVIPRGVVYAFEGQMTYLCINGPAFADGDDIYDLEED
ncbi:MAG: hypothetical protein FJW96_04970 [Actinobacteria bacterium]|nr:hypothetical protein [Actinomycetota bacterium]